MRFLAKWVDFKYLNGVGKPVGHTINIINTDHFFTILKRYGLDPLYLFDIKIGGKEISPEALASILYKDVS